jgi:hypothetical protein
MACRHGGAAFLTSLIVAASLRSAAARGCQVITQAGTWHPAARPRPGPRWRRDGASNRPGGTW